MRKIKKDANFLKILTEGSSFRVFSHFEMLFKFFYSISKKQIKQPSSFFFELHKTHLAESTEPGVTSLSVCRVMQCAWFSVFGFDGII